MDINKLIKKMNLKEKVAQLGSFSPERVMKKRKFSKEKADKFIKDGIGQISRVAGATDLSPEEAANVYNDLQKYLKEETRLGIPAIVHEECLSGFMGKGGTTYPQAIGMASSWNPSLLNEMSNQIRIQMRATGATQALSPLADLGRDPRWGRIEETYGEDPYLAAEMANAYVSGLQSDNLKNGAIATLKHFAGHGSCEGGRNHAPVNVSEKEFRETFLFPYEAVIRERGVGSIMNAYHDVDGIPAASSKKLLTDILRGEWEFDGIVVSDYFSINMLHTDHRVAKSQKMAAVMALEAGLDIELPNTDCYEYLIEAVEEGLLSEAVIDQAVRRHLKTKKKLGLFENRFVDEAKVSAVFETSEQRELARKAAGESFVLLKNENDLLPLDKDLSSIAVIGPSADNTRNMLGDYAYSAHVESKEDAIPIVSILDGVKNKLSDQVEINYAQGCPVIDEDRSGFAEAIELAEKSEVAVMVLGGKSGLANVIEEEDDGGNIDEEGFYGLDNMTFSTTIKNITDTAGEHNDRTDLELPGLQLELLKEIEATGTPVVLVLINGRPLSINWAQDNIPAIIEAWLPGEEGGNALADIIFGDENPAGKLPVSIPKNTGQLPINYNRKSMSHNRDYIFKDNRPLYPFGFGLSYTDFKYSNLKIDQKQVKSLADIKIEFELKNTGQRAGAEVAQLYINDPYASRTRPIKELKGFKKVYLEPGESKKIEFTLNTEQLAFYSPEDELIVEAGKYNIMIGSSAEDIELNDVIEVKETKAISQYYRKYFTKTAVK
ncbi:MAG: glycoside hydrolase family 3 N-terminal domain-containing protein [Bacillota bacterium]